MTVLDVDAVFLKEVRFAYESWAELYPRLSADGECDVVVRLCVEL